MVSRILIKRVVPLAIFTALFAGCLELGTTEPTEGEWSSTGSTSSSSSSTSASSSNGSGESSASSSSSSAASSSSTSSASSSSSSSASSTTSSSSSSSSGKPYELMVVGKSNLGTTFQNDSQGVVCAVDSLALPDGSMGDALQCTHATQMSGLFFHGLSVTLEADIPYVFTFFFRNGSFDSPYGHLPPEVGVKMIGPNSNGGGGLITFDPYPNGWYRQRYWFTPGNSGSYQLGLMHSLDRPAGGQYWLYGFQMETGTSPTQYLP